MEEQNKQPMQEATEIKHPIKTNWKFIAIIVFLAVVVGGGIVWFSKQEQAPPEQIPGNEGISSLPVIKLKYQGKTYAGKQGSYCWPTNDKEGGMVCVDKIFPESSEIISVKQGDTLSVPINAAKSPKTLTASTFVYLDQPAIKTFSLSNELTPSFQMDHPPGTYFLLLSGTWEEGDISYGFKMDVQPQGSTAVDTTSWQTYRNEEFGFEVTYPGSLHYWYPNATRGKPDTFGVSLLSVVMQQDGGMWSPSVRISVYSAHGYFAPEAIDLLAWISDNAPTNLTGDKSLLSETAESSLDNRWARTASLFSFDATKRIIIAGNGSYIYTISYDESTPNDPLLEEHLKIYEQILSTFRFTR